MMKIWFCSRVPFCCDAFVRKTLVVDMDVHDDHAHRGAARRRRERRLRAFLLHEKLSLAMQMATVSHHLWHRAGRADASTQALIHTDAATCAATAAPAPVFEYVAPAPVIENIAPASAVTFDAPSQQLLPAYTTTTVTTGVNLDIAGLVTPQFSSTAVEASAPQVVVSLPPFEEFTAPVYNQVHQEQIVAGEVTLNIVGNPAVQEQVIVQEIPQAPQVVDSFPVDFPIPPVLDDEQMLLRYQAHIDQCVHMLKTMKEDLARYEKQTAALLERAPRAASHNRREWQKVVDENNALILHQRQLVQTTKEKLASLMREMQEKREHAAAELLSEEDRRAKGRYHT